MHDLLLQRAEQALYDAVRLGLADEGVARRHAPEPDLLLEDVRHEVAAVVVAEREAAGGACGEVAELLADGHAESHIRQGITSEIIGEGLRVQLLR